MSSHCPALYRGLETLLTPPETVNSGTFDWQRRLTTTVGLPASLWYPSIDLNHGLLASATLLSTNGTVSTLHTNETLSLVPFARGQRCLLSLFFVFFFLFFSFFARSTKIETWRDLIGRDSMTVYPLPGVEISSTMFGVSKDIRRNLQPLSYPRSIVYSYRGTNFFECTRMHTL